MGSLHVESGEGQPGNGLAVPGSLISDRTRVMTLALVREELRKASIEHLPPEAAARHIRMLQLAEQAVFVAAVEASYPEED